jgi:hypothetical protein
MAAERSDEPSLTTMTSASSTPMRPSVATATSTIQAMVASSL